MRSIQFTFVSFEDRQRDLQVTDYDKTPEPGKSK